jgi:hypothetical protein
MIASPLKEKDKSTSINLYLKALANLTNMMAATPKEKKSTGKKKRVQAKSYSLFCNIKDCTQSNLTTTTHG